MFYRADPMPGRRSGLALVAGAAALLWLAGGSPAGARTVEDYVSSAQQYVAKGNLSAAEIELRNALRESPNDATLHLHLGQLYLQIGNHAGAEREARAAGTLGLKEGEYLPVLMDALLRQRKFGELLGGVPAGNRDPVVESKVREGRAFAYFGLRNRDEAIANLRESIRLDPAAPLPKVALARALLSSKEFDEAERLIDEVLAKTPPLADALQVKGLILRMRGDADGAMQKFAEALERDPKNANARLARAELYLLRGDAANANKDIDAALAAVPNSPSANYMRALELAQRQEFAAANQLLDKISPAFPDMIEGFYLQSVVQTKLGQLEQAESNLAKYMARVPESPKALRLMAEIAMRRGAAPKAVDYLKQLIDKSGPDAVTLSMLGNAYLAQGSPESAMAQFEAAAKLAPDNPALKTQLALSRIDVGQGEEGLTQLEGIFQSEAGSGVAGPALVISELRAGHVAKAAEVAEALVAKDAGNSVYQTLLGLVRVVQRDYGGAETALRTVVERDPGFAPATRNLAQLYIATGRRDQAKKAYEGLLARKPDDVTALLALADLAAAERDWKAATDYVNRARSAAPSDPKPGVKLVELYLQQQKYRDAQAIAGELITLFPKDLDVIDAEARSQLAAGDAPGAAATYRAAFEAHPDSAAIRDRYVAALRAAKDPKTARTVLEASLAREPANVTIKVALIGIEAEIAGVDAAVAKAREFAVRDPKDPAYDVAAAELLEKANRVPDAIALLEKRQQEQPAETAMVALAQLYMRAGQGDKAASLLEAHLDKQPGDVSARLLVGSHYLQQEQYDRARQEYERVISEAPTSIIALNNLAWIYQQRGDMAKAREVAERAATIAPQNPSVADTLGWILIAQGDNNGALNYLKLASAGSRDPDIHYHFAVALQRAGRVAEARSELETIVKSPEPFASKADAEKLLETLAKS